MEDILEQARRVFAAAGTDLSNVARALVFHSEGPGDIRVLACRLLRCEVQAGLTVDLWGYAPHA